MHGTLEPEDEIGRNTGVSPTGGIAARIGRTLAWSTGLVVCLAFVCACIWAMASNG